VREMFLRLRGRVCHSSSHPTDDNVLDWRIRVPPRVTLKTRLRKKAGIKPESYNEQSFESRCSQMWELRVN
jgi:hypothetical protein